MDPTSLAENPFAALSFIAAPALLTNASSVFAMSTINRMLRTRDSMRDLLAKTEAGGQTPEQAARLLEQVNRVERQAALLLQALRSIYIALAAFACATLVTLLGAGLAAFSIQGWPRFFAAVGVLLGFIGVGGMVIACVNLFHATQLSLANIRQEAEVVRQHYGGSAAASIQRK
jgi:hypothetical protein